MPATTSWDCPRQEHAGHKLQLAPERDVQALLLAVTADPWHLPALLLPHQLCLSLHCMQCSICLRVPQDPSLPSVKYPQLLSGATTLLQTFDAYSLCQDSCIMHDHKWYSLGCCRTQSWR